MNFRYKRLTIKVRKILNSHPFRLQIFLELSKQIRQSFESNSVCTLITKLEISIKPIFQGQSSTIISQ